MKILKKLFFFCAFVPLAVVLTSTLQAQEFKLEIIPYAGYSFSEGVGINPTDVGDGIIVDEVNPKSGYSYGFSIDALVSEHFAIGFNFNEQQSSLEGNIKGTGKREFTDMKLRNYHAIFTYNLGDEDDGVRPFVFGGLGATQYSPDDIMGTGVEGDTRFSSTWGGGVKLYGGKHVGVRLTCRWTPTYIKSDPSGIWCSPYWPWQCWVVGEANYSHQFEMTAVLILRF